MFNNITTDRPLAIFDLETTGKQVEHDRMVEICVMKHEPGRRLIERTVRLNPGMPIPPEASAVHGIYDVDVADERSFSEIAPRLAAFLDGCDLAGFNILSFDVKLLAAEFKRAGVPFSLAGRRFVDAMRLYHQREKRDLAAALKFYCDRDHEGAHGARADIYATRDILDAQVVRYGDLPRTIGGLHDHLADPAAVDFEGKFRRTADGVVVFAFSKDHKGKPLEEVAYTSPGFLRWMLAQDFMDDTKALVADALARANESFSHTYTS